MPREVNATLRQKGNFGQIREFQILDGKELRIHTQVKSRQFAYLISLLALEDAGRHRFHFAWRWLIAAGIALTLLLVFYGLIEFVALDIGIFAFPMLGGLSLLTLAFLVLFFTNTCRQRIYRARHSHVELFRIRVGKPTQREFKVFIDVLDSYIAKCRDYWRLSKEQQLAGELRTLRRLVKEKVISQNSYEAAKSQLFAMRNSTPQSGASAG